MPRKVEASVGQGWFEIPGTLEDARRVYAEARHVGGVLEWSPLGPDRWQPCSNAIQSQTLEEARSACPQYCYRLRPYEDAVPPMRMSPADKVERAKLLGKMLDAGVVTLGVDFGEDGESESVADAIAMVRLQGERAQDQADDITTQNRLADACSRANRLSDECGELRTERDELLRENAVLRRKVEKLERGTRRPGRRW